MFKEDAIRCLKCANPFCEKGCPIATPIKDVIALYNDNKILEAGEILFENNPFSALCGILCPHENQCEGSCVLGIKGEPVAFGAIEEDISTQYLKQLHFAKPQKSKEKIAVVGGGPAGVTSAILLAQEGFDVTLYDKHYQLGGILTYGIPKFRYDHDILEEYPRLLNELGVTIVKQELNVDITLDELKQTYDYINLAFGLAHSSTINVEGVNQDNVLLGTEFLKDACYFDYDNLVVIGTGNVAMDVARSAKRCGAKNVSVVRRRGSENMSSTTKEIQAAKDDGVNFEFYLSPYQFKDKQAIFLRTKDEDGKLLTTDEKVILDADYIVLATGQEADQSLITSLGLALNEWGHLKTNERNQTSDPQIFASGDINLGAQTVVKAVKDAKNVVENIKKMSTK